MKQIIQCFLVAVLISICALTFAQTSPGWTTGFVPTAAQWNAEWASKADVTSSAVAFTGGSMNGVVIGGSSAANATVNALTANGTVTGTGFSNLFASPYALGGTSPSTGAFTSLSASSTLTSTGTVTGSGFSNYMASPPAIGGTAAAAGSFTTLSASSTVSGTGFSTYLSTSLASPPAIGGTTPAAGAFTTLSASSTLSTSSTLTAVSSITSSGGRKINSGTTSDTLAAGIASTYESANTAAGAFTVTIAAPTGDGERRRICFLNATGTITWTVTSPATQTRGLPTTMTAGSCAEMVYSSVNNVPTGASATTWYVY